MKNFLDDSPQDWSNVEFEELQRLLINYSLDYGIPFLKELAYKAGIEPGTFPEKYVNFREACAAVIKELGRQDKLRALVMKAALEETRYKNDFLNMLERPARPGTEKSSDLCLSTPPPNPYRGLHAFQYEDARYFFGREAFVQKLKTAVDCKPFVAVIGPSGCGKSSVVAAGLLPKIGKEMAVFQFRPGSPNNKPFINLLNALTPLDFPPDERQRVIQNLASDLQQRRTDLTSVISEFTQRMGGKERVLLVVEQFEELFSLYTRDVQEALIDCLMAAVRSQAPHPQPGFTLLITMRTDFWGQATANRSLADLLQDGLMILGPMTREELETAIKRPAEVAGVQFEPGLVNSILSDVGDDTGNLPLLEFALTLLWEKQVNGRLSYPAYESIGKVQGALTNYAEIFYSTLSSKDQELVQFIFTQLVQPRRSTEDTRRQATISEIGEENWGLVTQLADARLVVTDRNEEGEKTVELVHVILISHWQKLRDWMNAVRLFRVWQERLRDDLDQWQAEKQDDGGLLRGALLEEAEKWLKTIGYQLQADEREYIYRSMVANDPKKMEEWIPRYGNTDQILELADTYLNSNEIRDQIRGIQVLRYAPLPKDNSSFEIRDRLFEIIQSSNDNEVQNQAGVALFEKGYGKWSAGQLVAPGLQRAVKSKLIDVLGFIRNQPALGLKVEENAPGSYKGRIQVSAARQLISRNGGLLAIIIAFSFLASEVGNELVSQVIWSIQHILGVKANITHIFDTIDLLVSVSLSLYVLTRALIDKEPVPLWRALLTGFIAGLLSQSFRMIGDFAERLASVIQDPGVHITVNFITSPFINTMSTCLAMAVFAISMRMFYSNSYNWKKALTLAVMVSITAAITNTFLIPFLFSIEHLSSFNLLERASSYVENLPERMITLLYGFFISFSCLIGFHWGLKITSVAGKNTARVRGSNAEGTEPCIIMKYP